MKKISLIVLMCLYSLSTWGDDVTIEHGDKSLRRITEDLEKLQAFVYKRLGQEESVKEDEVPSSSSPLLLDKLINLQNRFAVLTGRVEELEFKLKKQGTEHQSQIQTLTKELADLKEKIRDLESHQLSVEDKFQDQEMEKLSAEALYEKAQAYKEKKDWKMMKKVLQKFVLKFPDHSLSAATYFDLATLAYDSQTYTDAAFFAAESFKKDPKGSRAPDVLLKMAAALKELGKQEEACVTLKKIREDYPGLSDIQTKGLDQLRTDLKCP